MSLYTSANFCPNIDLRILSAALSPSTPGTKLAAPAKPPKNVLAATACTWLYPVWSAATIEDLKFLDKG